MYISVNPTPIGHSESRVSPGTGSNNKLGRKVTLKVVYWYMGEDNVSHF